MALTLSKTLIATGQTVQASQITQSVDALTGTVAYDITISGSLTMTGSLKVNGDITGSLFGSSSFAVSSSRAVSSSFATTASYALNSGGAAFPYTGSAQITGSLTLVDNSPLNIGTAIRQQFVSFVSSGSTNRTATGEDIAVPGTAALPTPNEWLIIRYIDNTETLQYGYIPIYTGSRV
jgi:hypothetical protein